MKLDPTMRATCGVAVLAFFVAGAGLAGDAITLADGVAPHAGLDAAYGRFSEGYRTLEPRRVAEVYTKDALYLSPGADIRRGGDVVLGSFSRNFARVKEEGDRLDIRFHIVERQVSGDLAFDVGYYILERKQAAGGSRTDVGKFVVVARRGENDNWRFHVDGYSAVDDPPHELLEARP